MSIGQNLLFSGLAALLVVLAAFVFGAARRRHRVVDVAWGLGFVAVAVTTYVLSAGHGDPVRRGLITALTALWGLRLAVHIAWRGCGQGEDRRYEKLLSRATGSRTLYALRTIYLLQGLLIWFVSLPIQVAQYDPDLPDWWLLPGVVLWAVGMYFEAVGDAQLTRFTTNPANAGKVLDTGLWRYTRHPNHFGDACVWWGLWLMAAAGGWLGVAMIGSPILMTWFLAAKTGKPLLEESLLQRRLAYADYVQRTSGFLPLPPRRVQGRNE